MLDLVDRKIALLAQRIDDTNICSSSSVAKLMIVRNEGFIMPRSSMLM